MAVALIVAQGCADDAGPTIEPISPRTVSALDTLRIPLRIENPEGSLRFGLIAPELPSFDRTHTISGNSSGGEFRWTPLSNHVGTHEIVFLLLDGSGNEINRTQTVVTVEPSADSAPVFLRPSAPGQTFDLGDDPCVEFGVEVRDDDSASVTIDTRGDLPAGATLTQRPPRRADFRWCPEPDQVASSSRWTIELSADDGEHAETTDKNFIVRLRGQTRDDCPGTGPSIAIASPSEGATVPSEPGFPVFFSVSDDMALRELPVVYYTRSEPEGEKPDISEFEEAVVIEDGENFRARIPNDGLSEGEEETIWYFVSATDNDDATGALCDHRTDSAVVSFTALGGDGDGLSDCDICGGSSECLSGVCVTTTDGGRCLPVCTGEGMGDCAAGTCANRVTREGGAARTCGTVNIVCKGGGSGDCTDDGFEPNDSLSTAVRGSASLSGQICAEDPDYYRINATAGREVTVRLDGFTHADGDLDLELLSTSGMHLGLSEGTTGEEEVSYCADSTGDIVVLVYGYETDENAYDLSVTEGTSACCLDDDHEGDDSRSTANAIVGDSFEGTICPDDSDYYRFSISAPTMITASIVFSDSVGDLDMELYSPSGAVVGTSAGSSDIETVTKALTEPGTYTIRVYGYRGAGGEYIGELTMAATSGCTGTSDCPVGEVCQSGACRNAACDSAASCPAGHGCPVSGPPVAMRQCGEICAVNGDCRSGESCKRFPEGRFCLSRGAGANGDACGDYSDCGGQRACLPYTGGYCARAGCDRNTDCESGTSCIRVSGQNICALECPIGGICRTGYRCAFEPLVEGGSIEAVCVP